MMAKQVENVSKMGTRSGGIRFTTSHPLDDALRKLCEEHGIMELEMCRKA
jgi:hypothetical protein